MRAAGAPVPDKPTPPTSAADRPESDTLEPDMAAEPAFDRAQLLPAIVQDARTRRVLMLGYMNQESYELTLAEGEVWFWSRSRERLWRKGETSGNVLRVRKLGVDCDGDTILVLADPAGPTCHTDLPSCFDRPDGTGVDDTGIAGVRGGPPDAGAQPMTSPAGSPSDELFAVVRQRLAERPEGSYVAKLAAGGTPRIAKKVGEEATEVVIAALNRDPAELTREMADLWFHAYVLLAEAGLTPEDVWAELAARRR